MTHQYTTMNEEVIIVCLKFMWVHGFLEFDIMINVSI
jgi:hypothetical protein